MRCALAVCDVKVLIELMFFNLEYKNEELMDAQSCANVNVCNELYENQMD